MFKYFFKGVLILLLTSPAYGQNLTVADLIKLISMSHPQATKFIVNERKFDTISSISVYHRTISQYHRNTSKTEEFVVKNEWEDNHHIFHAVHYEFRLLGYTDFIIKQLEAAGFSLTSKEDHQEKHVKFYQNNSYIVSIYTFENKKLNASVELHEKY